MTAMVTSRSPLTEDEYLSLARLISAADHPTWRARHKLLLQALAVEVGEGRAQPAVALPQLAGWCRSSVKLTLRLVADLEACGALVVVLRASAPGRRALWPAAYRINTDALAAMRRPDA